MTEVSHPGDVYATSRAVEAMQLSPAAEERVIESVAHEAHAEASSDGELTIDQVQLDEALTDAAGTLLVDRLTSKRLLRAVSGCIPLLARAGDALSAAGSTSGDLTVGHPSLSPSRRVSHCVIALKVAGLSAMDRTALIDSNEELLARVDSAIARCESLLAALRECTVSPPDGTGMVRCAGMTFRSAAKAGLWKKNKEHCIRLQVFQLHQCLPPRARLAAAEPSPSTNEPPSGRCPCCASSSGVPVASRPLPVNSGGLADPPGAKLSSEVLRAKDTPLSASCSVDFHELLLMVQTQFYQSSNPECRIPEAIHPKDSAPSDGDEAALAATAPRAEASIVALPRQLQRSDGEVQVIELSDLLSGKYSSLGGGSQSSPHQAAAARHPELWQGLLRPKRTEAQVDSLAALVSWYGLDPCIVETSHAQTTATRLVRALVYLRDVGGDPSLVVGMVSEMTLALNNAINVLFSEAVDDDGDSFAPLEVQEMVSRAVELCTTMTEQFMSSILQWSHLLQGSVGGGDVLTELLVLWRTAVRARNDLSTMGIAVESVREGEVTALPGIRALLQCIERSARIQWEHALLEDEDGGKRDAVAPLPRERSFLLRHFHQDSSAVSSARAKVAFDSLYKRNLTALSQSFERLQATLTCIDTLRGAIGAAIRQWTSSFDEPAPTSPASPQWTLPEEGVDQLWASTVAARTIVTAALVDVQVTMHTLRPQDARFMPEVFGMVQDEASGAVTVQSGALRQGVFAVFLCLLRLFRQAGADIANVLGTGAAGAVASPGIACVVPQSRIFGCAIDNDALIVQLRTVHELFLPFVSVWIAARRQAIEEDTIERALREGIRTSLSPVDAEGELLHSVTAGLLFWLAKTTIAELRALPVLLQPETVSRAGLLLLTWPVAALAQKCVSPAVLALSSDAHGAKRSESSRSTSWLVARHHALWLMAKALGGTTAPSNTQGIAAIGMSHRVKRTPAQTVADETSKYLTSIDKAEGLSQARKAILTSLQACPWPEEPVGWHRLVSRFFALTPPDKEDSEATEAMRRVVVLLNDAVYCNRSISSALEALDSLVMSDVAVVEEPLVDMSIPPAPAVAEPQTSSASSCSVDVTMEELGRRDDGSKAVEERSRYHSLMVSMAKSSLDSVGKVLSWGIRGLWMGEAARVLEEIDNPVAPTSPTASSVAASAVPEPVAPTIEKVAVSTDRVHVLRMRIAVLSASNVPFLDAGGLSPSDPYACVSLAASKEDLRDFATCDARFTRVVEDSAHPQWNQRFELCAPDCAGAWVRVSVHDWDGDESKPDDFVGSISLPIAPLVGRGVHQFHAWLRPEAEKVSCWGDTDVLLPGESPSLDQVRGEGAPDLIEQFSPSHIEAEALRKQREGLKGAKAQISFMALVDRIPLRTAAHQTVGRGLRSALSRLARMFSRGMGSLLLAGLGDVTKGKWPATKSEQMLLAARCTEPVIAYLDQRYQHISGWAYPQLLPRFAEELIRSVAATTLQLLLPDVHPVPSGLTDHWLTAQSVVGNRHMRSFWGSLIGSSKSTMWLQSEQILVLAHTFWSVIRYFTDDDYPLSAAQAMDAAQPVPTILAWWFSTDDFLTARAATLVIKALDSCTQSEAAVIAESGAIVSTAPYVADSIRVDNEKAFDWLTAESSSGDDVVPRGWRLDPLSRATDATDQAKERIFGFAVRGMSVSVLEEMLRYRSESLRSRGAELALHTLRKSLGAAIDSVKKSLHK
jgi:hypothetical protein